MSLRNAPPYPSAKPTPNGTAGFRELPPMRHVWNPMSPAQMGTIIAVFMIFLFICMLLSFVLASYSHAAPPPGVDRNSPISEWFQSLRQPKNNSSCCDIADCGRAVMRYEQGRIEVLDKDTAAWLPVPQDTIIATTNPTGEPVACIYHGRVLCFIRGTEI